MICQDVSTRPKCEETHQLGPLEGQLLLRYNSLPCGSECLLRWPQASGQHPRKMDEIMMARCLSTVGEPRSEIPYAPHLFLIGRIVKTCFLLQGKDLKFLWIYLLDTETSSVSLVIYIESYFYCVNTSYPMDNCFTGRRDRSVVCIR